MFLRISDVGCNIPNSNYYVEAIEYDMWPPRGDSGTISSSSVPYCHCKTKVGSFESSKLLSFFPFDQLSKGKAILISSSAWIIQILWRNGNFLLFRTLHFELIRSLESLWGSETLIDSLSKNRDDLQNFVCSSPYLIFFGFGSIFKSIFHIYKRSLFEFPLQIQ